MSKIKLTERQILMLQKLESSPRVIKITESQYKRLFKESASKEISKQFRKIGIRESEQKEIDIHDFAREVIVFIKDIIKNPKDVPFSSYWKGLGITKRELFDMATKEGILTPSISEDTGQNIYEAKRQGFRKGVKNMYKKLTESMLSEAPYPYTPDWESDGHPNDPRNEKDSDYEQEPEREPAIRVKKYFKDVYFSTESDDLMLFTKNGTFYVFVAATVNEDEYENYTDFKGVIDRETIIHYVNDRFGGKEAELNDEWNYLMDGYLCVVTPDLKEELFDNYGGDVKLVEYLNKLPESTMSSSSGPYTGAMGGGPNKKDTGLSPEEAMSELINDGEELYETTSTVSGGEGGEGAWGAGPLSPTSQTTGNLVVPLNRDLEKDRKTGGKATSHPNSIIKRPIGVNEGIKVGQVYSNGSGRAKIEKIIDRNNITIRRWGDVSATSVNIGKNELGGWTLISESKKVLKITESQLKRVLESENLTSTAYPNGEMVSFDDCTKLDNNKVAQNGGCSQGDDGVVRLKKTKASVVVEIDSLKKK